MQDDGLWVTDRQMQAIADFSGFDVRGFIEDLKSAEITTRD
jgi:hypothetical protein